MSRKAVLLVAALVLAGCGQAVTHRAAPPPVNRLATIDKSLVGTTTTGAREGVTTLQVTTTRSAQWVRVVGACTGGGELGVTLRVPTRTWPLVFICDSRGANTDVADMQVLPDNGAIGRAVLTITPGRGQTWWAGAGVTNEPVGGVDRYAHP